MSGFSPNILTLIRKDFIYDISKHRLYKFEMIGLVKGNMIQSVHFGKDLVNSFKTLVGGELTSYTEMMNEARAIATKRMSEEAEKCGADAVINIRYASSTVVQGAAEIMAYGTAVKFVEE